MVSKPFIFDNRQLPKTYEGLDIKSKIEGDLPKEFAFNKDAIKKELEDKKRMFELRISSVEKQENLIEIKAKELQEEARKAIKSGRK